MKPILEYLPKATNESFVVKYFDYNYFPTPWHFHPEYELVLVVESTGTKLIGDSISRFAPGDLLLIGPYLPHTYTNDKEYLHGRSRLRAKSIVVHFGDDVFGPVFFALPELNKIRHLLTRSKFGISVNGKTNRIISGKLFKLIGAGEFNRIGILLDILHRLSVSDEISHLHAHSVIGCNEAETGRMNLIINFVIKNFDRQFGLEEVAGLAGLTKSSFSRYFSQHTRKSFTEYVNEVRLKHAATQLIETTKPVTAISLESGFANLSNFNRQFRLLYNTNPSSYRSHYRAFTVDRTALSR